MHKVVVAHVFDWEGVSEKTLLILKRTYAICQDEIMIKTTNESKSNWQFNKFFF
jgi:hypothetical protein